MSDMEQEFELWRHREYGAQAEYQGAFEIAGLYEAFLAGCEVQKRKDAEIVKTCSTSVSEYAKDVIADAIEKGASE